MPRRGTGAAGGKGLTSAAMIRVIDEDAVGAIELLGEQHPGKRVRQGQPRQRQCEVAARQHPGGQAVGTAYEECQVLTLLHATAEPRGELARRELPAALIERNDVVSRHERGEQLLAFAGDRLWRVVSPSGSGLNLGQSDRETAAQTPEVLVTRAAYPGRHARAHGDHAHAHDASLPWRVPPLPGHR